jgi:hypothetical protein
LQRALDEGRLESLAAARDAARALEEEARCPVPLWPRLGDAVLVDAAMMRDAIVVQTVLI